jgi:hypothetical protein
MVDGVSKLATVLFVYCIGLRSSVGVRPVLVGRCSVGVFGLAVALGLCFGFLLHITSDLINPFARLLISHSRRCRPLADCRCCGRSVSWLRSGGVPGGCGGCTLLRFPSGLHFALLHPSGCCCLFGVSTGCGVSVDATRFSWLCVSTLRFGRSALVCCHALGSGRYCAVRGMCAFLRSVRWLYRC